MKALKLISKALVLDLETALTELYKIIIARIESRPEDSYTAQLATKGLNYVVQKFGEEAVEVVIAALTESKDRFINEVADLLYHLLVLMALKNVSIDDIINELNKRKKDSAGRISMNVSMQGF